MFDINNLSPGLLSILHANMGYGDQDPMKPLPPTRMPPQQPPPGGWPGAGETHAAAGPPMMLPPIHAEPGIRPVGMSPPPLMMGPPRAPIAAHVLAPRGIMAPAALRQMLR
jgi:hypothetical protein